MIRPPPLHLQLDNRFPHPARTASEPKAPSFVTQLYKANWKNPVIAVAGLNGLRFAYACHNAFADAIVDDAEAADTLAKVSIALAVMYLTALLIDIYGIIAVAAQRLSLLRAYVILTLFSSVLVAGAAVLRGVAYFAFAEELVYECIALAVDGRAAEKSLFRSHPWPSSIYGIRHGPARKQCVYAWVAQSWTQVAAVFLFGVVPAIVYCALVLTYYRQATSATHGASLVRSGNGGGGRGYAHVAGADSARSTSGMVNANANTRRRVRAQPDTSSTSTSTAAAATTSSRGGALIAGTKRHYARPGASSTFTSHSLQRAHRPPPLIGSPSPVGLGRTPGPPSYTRRAGRVYAAFAAPVRGTVGGWDASV